MTKENHEEMHTEMPMDNGESIHEEVAALIEDIDKKINRFVSLTNAKGKLVKKRWRDIKKGRIEKVASDRVAELEKAVQAYYVSKGLTLNDGTWEFQVSILTEHKQKNLRVVLAVSGQEPFVELEVAQAKSTQQMFDEAFKYFAK